MPSVFRPVALLVVIVALTPVVSASIDTWDPCGGELVWIGLGDETRFATIYYVITGDTPDEGWGYVEDNGVAGLQRGSWGSKWGGPFVGDPCWTDHPAGPDFHFY